MRTVVAVRRVTVGLTALLLGLSLHLRAGDRAPGSRETDETVASRAQSAGLSRMMEIRSYNLKPGTRDRFHQLFLNEALPMLRRWKVDVVAYGPSLHDADSYYLMRAYRSLEDRQRSEDAFYGSEEWRLGPREAILADIASYTTVVISSDPATLAGLRKNQ